MREDRYYVAFVVDRSRRVADFDRFGCVFKAASLVIEPLDRRRLAMELGGIVFVRANALVELDELDFDWSVTAVGGKRLIRCVVAAKEPVDPLDGFLNFVQPPRGNRIARFPGSEDLLGHVLFPVRDSLGDSLKSQA